ncbi:YkgJ family cysteine cluster protein [Thermodesulfobacteriota bacterium]
MNNRGKIHDGNIPAMENEMIALSPGDTFRFSCSAEVPCFNACCQDLNQFLTPYDILRLKNRLGLRSNIFLEQYTAQHTGPETGLPVITLKTDHASGLRCPFVTLAGCRVYEDRPSSCRTYPLVRIVSRSRETGQMTEQHLLLQERHCHGSEQDKIQTVREWIAAQGIAVYNEMNDLLMDIISLKNRRMPGQIDLKSKYIFNLACYDLDTFRSRIIEEEILEDFPIDPDGPDIIQYDDAALLKLGLKWIKHNLFGA